MLAIGAPRSLRSVARRIPRTPERRLTIDVNSNPCPREVARGQGRPPGGTRYFRAVSRSLASHSRRAPSSSYDAGEDSVALPFTK